MRNESRVLSTWQSQKERHIEVTPSLVNRNWSALEMSHKDIDGDVMAVLPYKADVGNSGVNYVHMEVGFCK